MEEMHLLQLDYYSCIADFRGENLAGGQRTSEQVVKAWEESDKGHRELLLNPKVKKNGLRIQLFRHNRISGVDFRDDRLRAGL